MAKITPRNKRLRELREQQKTGAANVPTKKKTKKKSSKKK